MCLSRRVRRFGGPWIALQLISKLGLKAELDRLMPVGREDVPWSVMSLVLVICRLCDPSSELRIAEHLYDRSALCGFAGGGSADKVNDDRLYRALDALLPHKTGLEKHLKNKLGELFDLKYDLLLYDMTSTYFEGPVRRKRAGEAGLLARPPAVTASRSASGIGGEPLRHAGRDTNCSPATRPT